MRIYAGTRRAHNRVKAGQADTKAGSSAASLLKAGGVLRELVNAPTISGRSLPCESVFSIASCRAGAHTI